MGKILILSICLVRFRALKKKSFFLLSFLLVFSVLLFACNSINLVGGPLSSDPIYGNGGSAVVKGDYLYFANAFVDYNSISNNDNKYDEDSAQKIYGIYRTKLNQVGGVDLNDEGTREGVELLTYNVGGFAYAGLYIFGDYLYYATPYTVATNTGDLTYGLVRIDRVRLNGTEHEEIYNISNYSAEASYDLVGVDNVVYIASRDADNKLIVVSVNGGNKREVINIDGATSFSVFEQNNIIDGDTVQEINKYVYYTRQDSETSTYFLCRRPLAGGDERVLYRSSSELLVENVKNDRVYFTEDGVLKSFGQEDLLTYTPTIYTNITIASSASSITDYLILDKSLGSAGIDRGILGVYFDGTNYAVTYYNGGVIREIEILEDPTKEVTLIASQGNEFYYQVADDTSLYKCTLSFAIDGNKYTISSCSEPVVIATDFSYTVNSTEMIDFDKDRIFVYLQEEGDALNYLHMYMIDEKVSYVDETEGNIISRYIGLKQE